MAIHNIDVQQFFPMLQETTNRPFGASASNTLVFTQSTKVSPIHISVVQQLQLTDSFSFRTSIKNISVNQNLFIQQGAFKGPYYHHIDTFFMWHEARVVEFEQITQSLNFIQSIIAHKAKGTFNTLNLTHSATYSLVRSRTITHVLAMQGYARAYKIACDFISTGPVTLTTPDHIILTFGALILNLRNPNFGDAHGIQISRISRQNRGGDLIIYRDSQWPRTKTLRYSFSYLKENEKDQLLHFLKVSLGQQIQLIDYEGRTWLGVITTPAANVIHQGRHNYEAEFEFEGLLV